MKEPEMIQTIVIHHCLPYEIVFQVIFEKSDHIYILNGGKMW